MSSNEDTIEIVVLNGDRPMKEQYSRALLSEENGWENCPVPTLLGIPLMAKPIRPYPGGSFPDSQPAVFMMVNPDNGLSPMNWQLGPHCNRGMIGFGRKDGQPFTCKQWADLHSYIYDLMDLYSEGITPSAIKSRKLNPAAYNKYLKQC